MKSSVPQHKAAAILQRDREVMLQVYPRYDVVFTGGSGVYLSDESGRRYLDTTSGLGVNALGYAHPRMVEVLREQAANLIHISPHYGSPYPGELAEKLCSLSGMASAFYATGGTEAMESALKLARAAAFQGYGQQKHIFVSLRDSYHGRTGEISRRFRTRTASHAIRWPQQHCRVEGSHGCPGLRHPDRARDG
jgi:acetylornithine/N-succinyldiaminopimelate aminotransferase